MVVEHDTGWVAALLVYHSYLYVAQQSEQHKHKGEVKIWCIEASYHLGRHAIHDVAHQGYGGGDGDGLIDECEVVAHGVLAFKIPTDTSGVLRISLPKYR